MGALLSKLAGRQHHFKIRLKYVPDPGNGERHVARTVNIWFADRAMIADDRAIKQAVAPSMVSQIPANMKRNGSLMIEAVYYLGWFRPQEK